MTESLYIVVERHRRYWSGLRIAKVAKRKPTLARPSEQALIRLEITVPDSVLAPRVVRVDVKPEHVVTQAATAVSVPP